MLGKTISPYTVYNNWLFDGNIKSPIPKKDDDNNIPDILSYKSPITSQYMISLFINQGKLNHYLNQYFNNIGLYYLDKEDLMKFMKKCVIDFKIQKRNLPFIPYKRNSKLFEEFKKRDPLLKKYDISLLCDLVDKSDDKENIYYSLGLEKPEKIIKNKKSKNDKKINKKEKIKDFLKNNFKTMKM